MYSNPKSSLTDFLRQREREEVCAFKTEVLILQQERAKRAISFIEEMLKVEGRIFPSGSMFKVVETSTFWGEFATECVTFLKIHWQEADSYNARMCDCEFESAEPVITTAGMKIIEEHFEKQGFEVHLATYSDISCKLEIMMR